MSRSDAVTFKYQATTRSKRRAGSVLIAAVIAVAIVDLTVMSAITASGDDARLGGLHVDTVRAFYAAESGAVMAIGELNTMGASPVTGQIVMPGGEIVVIVNPFAAPPADPGTLIVQGGSGQAVRQISITAK